MDQSEESSNIFNTFVEIDGRRGNRNDTRKIKIAKFYKAEEVGEKKIIVWHVVLVILKYSPFIHIEAKLV